MLAGEDSEGRRPSVAEPLIPSCSQVLRVNAIGVAWFAGRGAWELEAGRTTTIA